MRQAAYFESAGVGLPREEFIRITLALRDLVDQYPHMQVSYFQWFKLKIFYSFLARLYESTGRAIAVTPASASASALASALASASALLKMLKFLVKVFMSLYLLKL